MKSILLLSFVFLSITLFSQTNDTIILLTGEIIPCKILEITKDGIVRFQVVDKNHVSEPTQMLETSIQEIRSSNSYYLYKSKKKPISKSVSDSIGKPISVSTSYYSAGNYLIRAKQTLIAGSCIQLIGMATTVVGVASKQNKGTSNEIQGVPELMYAGGGIWFLGFIVTMAGYVPIGKAGEIFNDKKIGHLKVKSDNYGVGLVYRF